MDVPKHIQLVFDYDRIFRSEVLHQAIDLEEMLDEVIAWHFCPDSAKRGLFFALLFREGEIGFGKKIRILRRLIKASYPDLNDSFSFFLRRLDFLRELRNKFAHGRLVLPDEAPPAHKADGVSLKYIKANGEEAEEFVARSAVDRHVAQHTSLLAVALCLLVIIKGRASGTADPEKEAGLIGVVGTLRKKIEQP